LGTASKFTGPDPDSAEKIFTAILSGGRDSIVELLELVREPSDTDYRNYKPTYVLHGLVIYTGRSGQENQRRLLARTIASRLDNDKHSKAVKAVLIRELRVLGGKESVDALGQQLLDVELCADAAQALLTIHEGVVSQFRGALNRSKGRNYLTILQALGVLQDKSSSAALKKALTDENRDVRRTAAWALANIGDADATDALLKSADSAEGWERTEATKACLLLAERLAAANQKPQATRIYTHLRDTRTDRTERHFRETAEQALSAFAQ
jgi:HEAT repeat protein